MNDAGQVVGESGRAFLYTASARYEGPEPDAGRERRGLEPDDREAA